ncbi:hypothetical protein EVAR_24732_1 [Eumeta japonica]|uniref:Uncharacterized protein n=1 Tax=Eumeta variegata TaxID=151549 RepID=A0A4C1VDQ7_EUMVA|nr:hypothetical protein EVAR_24732_1 [Eumeta japonica]
MASLPKAVQSASSLANRALNGYESFACVCCAIEIEPVVRPHSVRAADIKSFLTTGPVVGVGRNQATQLAGNPARRMQDAGGHRSHRLHSIKYSITRRRARRAASMYAD